MPIYFHREAVDLDIEEKTVALWINNTITELGFHVSEISIVFCNDNYLKTLNIQHLNHDYYTDIITFDYSNKKQLSGDLFISTERVKENAKINNVTFINELYRVIIHGVLHLCGFNDKTIAEKEEIRKKENLFLSLID